MVADRGGKEIGELFPDAASGVRFKRFWT